MQITLPYVQTFCGVAAPAGKEDQIVEFRLLFHGTVRPTGNKGHPMDTHAIRRVFHPQLRLLWATRPSLGQLAQQWSLKLAYAPPTDYLRRIAREWHPDDKEERVRLGFEAMGKNWARAGFNCVPLATDDLDATCSLDVLLLRPGPSMTRHILSQGDIDGQLKAIIDALRIPDSGNETGGAAPESDETPFFCLLENDRLVSEVRVMADELLSLPGKPTVGPNDAFVVVHAKVGHRHHRTFDNWLGSL